MWTRYEESSSSMNPHRQNVVPLEICLVLHAGIAALCKKRCRGFSPKRVFMVLCRRMPLFLKLHAVLVSAASAAPTARLELAFVRGEVLPRQHLVSCLSQQTRLVCSAVRKKSDCEAVFTNVTQTAPLGPRQPPLTITYTNQVDASMSLEHIRMTIESCQELLRYSTSSAIEVCKFFRRRDTHVHTHTHVDEKGRKQTQNHTDARTNAHTHAHTHTRTHTHTHTHMPTRTHTCPHAHTHAYIYILTHARTHTHMHACTHTHMHSHSNANAHTHTHTHAHTHTNAHTADQNVAQEEK